MPDIHLYVITPPVIKDAHAFAAILDDVMRNCPLACVQLRLKDASGGDQRAIIKMAEPIGEVTRAHACPLLINDNPAIVGACRAQGVHLGPEDADVKQARQLLGKEAIIGVSCRASRHLAFEAGEAGADYVSFGACYASLTKPEAPVMDLSLLTCWREISTMPSVAIGGITVETISPVIQAGADFVAVCSGLWEHPEGAGAAAKIFRAKLDEARRVETLR